MKSSSALTEVLVDPHQCQKTSLLWGGRSKCPCQEGAGKATKIHLALSISSHHHNWDFCFDSLWTTILSNQHIILLQILLHLQRENVQQKFYCLIVLQVTTLTAVGKVSLQPTHLIPTVFSITSFFSSCAWRSRDICLFIQWTPCCEFIWVLLV